MSFQWHDYLSVATEWMNGASTNNYPDAVYRSVISRAYYATFHAAFDLAQQLGLKATRSAGDHYRLRIFFEDRGRVAHQLSVFLRNLYDLRIGADYEINQRNQVSLNAPAAAQRALDLAHKAHTAIEYLTPKAK